MTQSPSEDYRWCNQCTAWRRVDEQSTEQIGAEETARTVEVVRLDCGHEEIMRRKQ